MVYKIFRPLLLRLPPEAAHALSLRFLPLFKTRKKPDLILETSVLGLRFKSPIGIAAGYDKDAVAPENLVKLGFGFVEVGTITPKPQKGNPKPRVFRLKEDRAVINRLGFNSKGAKSALKRLKKSPIKHRSGVLGVNIGANKDTLDRVADYIFGVKTFNSQADYLTVNISSPNTPGLRNLQHKEELKTLLKAVTETRSQAGGGPSNPPIFIKIAPDLTKNQLEEIIEIAIQSRVEGLIVSNTTVKRPKSLVSENKGEAGGLSGAPLFKPSTNLLKEAYKLSKGKLVLVGVGGISSGAEAYEKIKNGASLVQLYTGLIYEGPGMVERISKELAALVKKDGYASVSEAVGKGL